MATNGKRLIDLAYEVDVLRKEVCTIDGLPIPETSIPKYSDNPTRTDLSCISWQDDGTLIYFDYADGFPGFYWTAYQESPPLPPREAYTSLEGLITLLEKYSHSDKHVMTLLTEPVWCIVETHESIIETHESIIETHESIIGFNSLLGDIAIDL